jgi:hypothetical protein
VGADGGQGQTDSFGSKSDNSGKSRPTSAKQLLVFCLSAVRDEVMIKNTFYLVHLSRKKP